METGCPYPLCSRSLPSPLDSESFSFASCYTSNRSAEGMTGITLALEFIVMDEDSGSTVCLAQKHD